MTEAGAHAPADNVPAAIRLMTDEASRGSSANHAIRCSRTAGATDSRTSALPRKSRVAPSNSGRSSLAETTAVRPPQSRSAPRSASVLVSSCRSRAKRVEPFRPWPWPVDGDPHAAVGFQRDVDVFGATGEYLVDRPVGHLEHPVVQPGLTGRAHVHPRPLPDGFPPLQHLNVGGGVRARGVTQEAPSLGLPGVGWSGDRERRSEDVGGSVKPAPPSPFPAASRPPIQAHEPDSRRVTTVLRVRMPCVEAGSIPVSSATRRRR